jgi:DNA-binding NarL/FixJ family response regulator
VIKIIIADDHIIIRAGIKQLLDGAHDMVVAGEASDGQKLIQEIQKNHYDVIVIDISMPGRNGIEIIKQIRSSGDKTPILALSYYPEEQFAIRVLKAGACGYMNKDVQPEELVEAIYKVARGGTYVSPAVAEKLAMNINMTQDASPHESLTDREHEVFLKIAGGMTVSEIADEMFLSVKTVSTYRARILEKLNLKNNAEITYYAIRNNLIEKI